MTLEQKRFSFSEFKVNLSVLSIKGSDAKSFIGTQSTFDSKKIIGNDFHLISFLDPQGRLLSYGWLFSLENEFLYLVPHILLDSSIERLNRFLISEDVEISSLGSRDVFFAINASTPNGFSGKIFDYEAIASFESFGTLELNKEDVESLRILTGYPHFNPSEFKSEIINNTVLFDLSVSRQKGCYPGQETVNKIANNRGAAFYPLLLESNEVISTGDLFSFDKKIGEVLAVTKFADKYFAETKLLRDFRIEGLKLNFSIKDINHTAIVRYNPYLKGDRVSLSEEIYHKATLEFQKGDTKLAEGHFIRAIELNPRFADAYEAFGVMLGRENRFDEAISWMEKLAELDDSSVLAHTNLSMFYMKKGEIEKAEDHKSKATLKSFAYFGREAAEKEKQKKELEEKQSEWAKREEMFRQVLEIDSEDTLANFGLGTIAVERSEFQNAIHYLEAVLKADPKYSVAYLTLGQAYAGNKDLSKAKEIWKEGIKIAASKGDLMPANQMQALLNQN